MSMALGGLLGISFVAPILVILALIKFSAIESFRRRNYTASSKLSSLGEKLANSKIMKFDIVFAFALIGSLTIALAYTLYSWWYYTSRWYSSRFFFYSSLIPALILIPYLILGLIYATSTTRGLSWWNASVIIFRYHGFHERRSYLKNEIELLIEENEDGFDHPYCAYLTLERLFMQEFNAGQATREILGELKPELHEEFSTKLTNGFKNRRFSHFLLFIGVVFALLSIFFLFFGIYSQVLVSYYFPAIDFASTISLSFLLMWIVHSTFEIPGLDSTMTVHTEKDQPELENV